MTRTAPTADFYRSNALNIETGKCYHGHANCTVERIECAIQTPGGASHKMAFSIHSTTGEIYSGSRPNCGSRRILGTHTGAFVKEVTCGRCR